jgi:hypothetical protein
MAGSKGQRPKKGKVPKHSVEPTLQKRAKFNDPAISGLPLAWRFSSCDRGGPFAWTNLFHGAPFQEVVERLHEFERMSWEQIIDTGSHPIEPERFEKLARDRLAEIQQDDVDELMSFRISGIRRIWCIQDRNIMRVLWWDPDHRVCPSHKRHT